MEKGEIAHFEQFYLSLRCFPKVIFYNVFKEYIWRKELNPLFPREQLIFVHYMHFVFLLSLISFDVCGRQERCPRHHKVPSSIHRDGCQLWDCSFAHIFGVGTGAIKRQGADSREINISCENLFRQSM